MQRVWQTYLNPRSRNDNAGHAEGTRASKNPPDNQGIRRTSPTPYGYTRPSTAHRSSSEHNHRQELIPLTSADGRNPAIRDFIYSLSGMDHGTSPRTSLSSQAASSRPMLGTPSPDSSMNHSTTKGGATSPVTPNPLSGRTPRANPATDHLFFTLSSRSGSEAKRYAANRYGMAGLEPPSAPFAQLSGSPVNSSGSSTRTDSPGPSTAGGSQLPTYSQSGSASNIPMLGVSPSATGLLGHASGDASNVSLSVNYLPTKFSSGILNAEYEGKVSEARRRRGAGRDAPAGKGIEGVLGIPKMGGGVEAFRAGEARMGGQGEDDEDEYQFLGGMHDSRGMSSSQRSLWNKAAFWKKNGKGRSSLVVKRMRWNRFKWTLFFSNCLLTAYSFACLVVCLLLWFDAWTNADVVRVGNRTELIISTLASILGLFTCLLGWTGIVTNNRMFLAIYALLLWITFTFMLIPGYLTYKRRTFNLEGKINAQWSRDLGPEGRLRIQNHLSCCGYFSPYVEATVSQSCYSRSILPGCKKPYIDFEMKVLKTWYTVVFALAPVHILVIIVSLMCSNHVTYRFGKGMMPKRYRLSMASMAVIMDNYAQQLVEKYGADIASGIMTQSKRHSKGTFPPDMPTVGYLANGGSGSTSGNSVK